MNMEDIKSQWENAPDWQKFLVILLISASIGYLLYSLFLVDKIKEKETLARDVNNLKLEVLRLQKASHPRIKKKLMKKLKELENEIQLLNQKMEYLSKIIPEQEDPQFLLNFLSVGAKKTGMILEKFQISKPEDTIIGYKDNQLVIERIKNDKDRKRKYIKRKDQIKLKRIKITLNMLGDLNSLYNYIKYIGKSKRFIRTDQVVINKIQNLLKITIKLSTFYLPERRK